MVTSTPGERRIRGFCALCRSRCGCVSVVRDGRLVAVEPDPDHPTGRALCAKGRAAPELVHSPDRLLYPLKRTRPKGDPDPGWRRISWDEALAFTAAGLKRLAAESGPESVAFGVTTPSGTAISDAIQWIERLIRAYGSPNNVYGTEICNWHKDVAHAFTFGAGIGTPDLANAGCVLLWGHNPSTAWLAQAERVAAARARGARLVVVDPRRAGAAAKADHWLRPRPGTDGALALGIAGAMIREGWLDEGFVRAWTNAPLLVREDEGRLLTEADLAPGGGADRYVAWDDAAGAPALCDTATGAPAARAEDLRLRGQVAVPARGGLVDCRPVFDCFAERAAAYPPERVEAISWVPAAQVAAVARLLWEARPVCYHAWSGVGQHTNATQTERAIAVLYALTGSYDAPGGNVQLAKVPAPDLSGADLMPPAQAAKALGLAERPLGPARNWWVTADDLYRAILERRPYAVRGLVGFGANILVSRADSGRGAAALRALEFHVQADMVLTPTAAHADVVLPVGTAWEREALRLGFEISQEANALVQLRQAVLAPAGESRSDAWIAFELARRLGLGNRFWGGDLEAGWRAMLADSGLTLDALRAAPEGIRVPLETHYRKYAEAGRFPTPSGRVEIWSETLRRHGYEPLPDHVEPAVGPASRPDLAERYPLVLTSAKSPLFCHSQHRNLPRLRRRAPDPEVEMHPDAAAARGIRAGDWVAVETDAGAVRVKAVLKDSLDPRVVAVAHGWWQGCSELGLAGYDPLSADGANVNRLVPSGVADPISGSVPLRSYLCEVRRQDSAAQAAAPDAAE